MYYYFIDCLSHNSQVWSIAIVYLNFAFTFKHLAKTVSSLAGENNYTPFFTMLMTTTTEKVSNKQLELSRRGREFENTMKEKVLHNFNNISDFNLSNDSIEHEDNHWSDTKISKVELKPPNIIEPEINDYDVDILDDKNIWKPRLVFENKTEMTTASSVIMRIGPKNIDVELFNVETAPFQESKLMI